MKTVSKVRKLLPLLASSALILASVGPQKAFPTPGDAADALLLAMQSRSDSSFLAIAGEKMSGFWNSGDPDRDASERNRLLDAARLRGLRLAPVGEDRTLIYFGDIEEPFPAPLTRTGVGWRFDSEAGSLEIAMRRVRRNEVAAVELCRRFREAQFAYLGSDGLEMRAFAGKIRSTVGQRDGLFWGVGDTIDESPLGPPFAAAAFAERQPGVEPHPLFGYYFKVLVAQGPAAPGGAIDYRVKGQLRRGFALVAWPAHYGVDGVRSFLINHFGDVYQKDLGAETNNIAPRMDVFNPDPSWTRLERDEPVDESPSAAVRPD